MATTTLTITGIGDEQTGDAVRNALQDLPDITDVRLDLVVGGTTTVRLSSEGDVDREKVAAAVQEAGDGDHMITF